MLVKNWKNKRLLLHETTRQGYGRGLLKIGQTNKNIIVISADLTESTYSGDFERQFPEQFIRIGVSEQSLAGIAGGLALNGKIVFLSSYAAFSPGRNWEQIRTVACLQNTNIKIIGSHAGLSVGPDGATHQMTEDIALMRVLPNMTVLAPADAREAEKATIAAAKKRGPVYIRLARNKTPIFTTANSPFTIGEAQILTKGNDVAIVGAGPILYEALIAADNLKQYGIKARVINSASIKPLDEKTILTAAKECGAIVTVEDAQIAGGLGSAIAELTSLEFPVPIERIGLDDKFGESGKAEELFEKFKLTSPYIIKAAKKVIKKKFSR
ncbi:transketolase family protein [Candidatus Parcubacteria bacterium]|nr:MAG: transketolase family protein [Candidatus Parcubacteria bacterium]